MDKAKQVGNSSSSSLTMDDLFGPKDSLKSSSSSSGLFDSIFGPPATVHGRDTHRPEFGSGSGNAHKDMPQKNNGVTKNDKNSTNYENGTVEPCYYSSIYYGGRQVYSPPSTQNTNNSQPVFKKDGGNVDQNEGNSNGASRGNWWQGSLYY